MGVHGDINLLQIFKEYMYALLTMFDTAVPADLCRPYLAENPAERSRWTL